MQLASLGAALHHPDLLLAVYELNDAADEEGLKQKLDLRELARVLVRKDEPSDRGRLVDEILFAALLERRGLVLRVSSVSERKRPSTWLIEYPTKRSLMKSRIDPKYASSVAPASRGNFAASAGASIDRRRARTRSL